MSENTVGFFTLLFRGLRKQCPVCGSAGLYGSWLNIHDHCPRCGFRFERDPGYWVGAMMVNTAVAIGGFVVVFVGLVAATWPETPWTLLTLSSIVVMALVPVVFYPFSKTVWMALDVAVRPVMQEEFARLSTEAED
jgi:uncharacterized protein (DUF983 family)